MLRLPLLYGAARGPFLTAWSFDVPLVAGLALAAAGYGLLLRRGRAAGRPVPAGWRAGAYAAGLVAVGLALLGPIDAFDDDVFFLHMLQHLLLTQVAPPLLLLGQPLAVLFRGLPPRWTRRIARRRGLRALLGGLTQPLVALLLFNATLVIWHAPALYDAAVRHDQVHDLEHLTFFVLALGYWWRIVSPTPRHHRLAVPWLIGSLFATMMVGTALGAVLTLSSDVIYPAYLQATNPFGIAPLVDQQLGGLLIWIVGGAIYSAIALGTLVSHLSLAVEPDEEWAAGAVGDTRA